MSFLPGWFPAGAVSAKAKLTTLAQVLSATDGAGPSFTLPSGIQAGDLIVVWDWAWTDEATPSAVTPSGFTQIVNVAGTDVRGILSYKIADGSEGGASVNGMVGGLGEAKAAYVFRGDIPITSATPADAASQVTDGNPTAQTVNASGGAVPLVVLGCYASTPSGIVSPRTFSPAKDGEINVTDLSGGGFGDMWLAYKIYNASPADVTVDMDDEINQNTLASCYIACS